MSVFISLIFIFSFCIVEFVRYYILLYLMSFFFFKQKTAYEMRISDWSSDVCSSELKVMCSISSVNELNLRSVATFNFAINGSSSALSRTFLGIKIGRASCRERVCQYV